MTSTTGFRRELDTIQEQLRNASEADAVAVVDSAELVKLATAIIVEVESAFVEAVAVPDAHAA